MSRQHQAAVMQTHQAAILSCSRAVVHMLRIQYRAYKIDPVQCPYIGYRQDDMHSALRRASQAHDATNGFSMPVFAQASLMGICSVPFAGCSTLLLGACALGLRACSYCRAATFSPRARAKNCFAHSCRTCDSKEQIANRGKTIESVDQRSNHRKAAPNAVSQESNCRRAQFLTSA